MTQALAPTWARAALLAAVAFLAVGFFGVYRYVDNYWLYRGFAPPRDPAFVKVRGHTRRASTSRARRSAGAPAGRVYLPPGYAAHPRERYPVLYLLHGFPGRPGAFLQTVRMGVVEDELVALHRARPLILVMPFGSTGSFTDKEWANGIRQARRLGDVRRARPRSSGRRALPHDRAAGGRAIGGLSEGGYGAINIAVHHPREFKRRRELVAATRGADPIRSIFGNERALLHREQPALTIRGRGGDLRAGARAFWFYTGTEDRTSARRTRLRLRARRARHLRTASTLVRGGHNWAIWRGNAARAYLAASRRLRAA